MSRSSQAQLEPVPTQAAGIDPAWATNRARLDGNRAQPSGLSGDVAAPSNSGGNLNKSQLSDWMDAHALSRPVITVRCIVGWGWRRRALTQRIVLNPVMREITDPS